MEPARTEVADDTWRLNRTLANARASIELSQKKIRQWENHAAEQLAIAQDARRQMFLLGVKEHV